MKKHRFKIGIALFAVVMGGLLIGLNYPWEYSRLHSPDGKYFCVAYSSLWRSLIPASPGGGGDKSGYVEMFTVEGKSLGSAPIEMVSMIHDLTWRPGEAEIKLVHTWSLPDPANSSSVRPAP